MDDKNPIFRSLAIIEERLQEKLTVEILAECAHFSKYHYQRIFREAVGDTVMGYVTRRRLMLAAEALAGTRDSILDIALKYGYDSHEGFTRSFKAFLGVTPTEYRKYHTDVSFPGKKKEERTMMDSKNTEEMIRELNSLIVQAKETAEASRKQNHAEDSTAAYAKVWEFAAGRAEKMAEELKAALGRVTDLTRRPDEISARFLIIKAVEDAAFEASVTAFQVGLMIARAMPEHRAAFQPMCARYDSLAQNARMKSAKVAAFLEELSSMLLADMREEARRRIRDAVEAGMAAAGRLSDPALPYGYLAEGVREIAEELDSLALEDVTLYFLEDAVFRMGTILFAADMDLLRAPQHRQLLDGISDFGKKLEETAEFFRNLSGDAFACGEAKAASGGERGEQKLYGDLAMQEGILLFYLKGEIQKLGNTHLEAGQRAALDAVCAKMDRAVKLARNASDKGAGKEISGLLHEAYDGLKAEAGRLGIYGGAIEYLAEEVNKPLKYLAD